MNAERTLFSGGGNRLPTEQTTSPITVLCSASEEPSAREWNVGKAALLESPRNRTTHRDAGNSQTDKAFAETSRTRYSARTQYSGATRPTRTRRSSSKHRRTHRRCDHAFYRQHAVCVCASRNIWGLDSCQSRLHTKDP